MSYTTKATISKDSFLKDRIHAAIIAEDISSNTYRTPQALAVLQREMDLNMAYYAGQPGWSEAWEYAINIGRDENSLPLGQDPTVITDGMILSAVQVLANNQ